MRFLVVALSLCVTITDGLSGEKRIERIAFGSCVHQEDPQPIWDPIRAAKPDLFLLIGDNIYHDVHRSKEAKGWTIREKYALQANVPGFKQLRAVVPVMGTWDDHDYGVNDAGEENAEKKDYQEAFLDFFGVPKDSPRRKQEGIYHAEIHGPLEQSVQLILLDTRYFRSPLLKKAKSFPGVGPYLPDTDVKKTMLGEAQWTWLEEQLRKPAKVRILASSIQVVPEDHGWEKWMNFPHERERLFKLIRDTKAAGIVCISGDRHLAELSQMDAGIGYPLFDLTSSGLTMASPKWRALEVNRHRVATMNHGNNFGFLSIDWTRKDPIISMQIRDEVGDVMIQEKIPLSVLQPGRLKIKDAPAIAGPKLNGQPITNELVKELLGKDVTLVMTVQATGAAKKGDLVFLNSTADRGPDNLTVVLDSKALREEKASEVQKNYSGKRIRVTGTLSTFRDQVQVMVSDLKQIEMEKE